MVKELVLCIVVWKVAGTGQSMVQRKWFASREYDVVNLALTLVRVHLNLRNSARRIGFSVQIGSGMVVNRINCGSGGDRFSTSQISTLVWAWLLLKYILWGIRCSSSLDAQVRLALAVVS